MFIEQSRRLESGIHLMPIKRKMLDASSWFPNQHTPSINRCGGM